MDEIKAKVIADSISHSARLVTMELTYPRYILAELNTHRMLSKNTASSRAIPVLKVLERAKFYTPETWWKNKPGMSSDEVLPPGPSSVASDVWKRARGHAEEAALELSELGVHKQLVNRLLEPFLFVTTLVSATEWANLFHLRTLEAGAQPDFAELVSKMKVALKESTPKEVNFYGWHAPLTDDLSPDEFDRLVRLDFSLTTRPSVPAGCLISAARCARVSLLNHEGTRDLEKDVELALRLLKDGHLSPFEHVAKLQRGERRFQGNFFGWTQLRKMIPFEWDFLGKEEYHHD